MKRTAQRTLTTANTSAGKASDLAPRRESNRVGGGPLSWRIASMGAETGPIGKETQPEVIATAMAEVEKGLVAVVEVRTQLV